MDYEYLQDDLNDIASIFTDMFVSSVNFGYIKSHWVRQTVTKGYFGCI